MNGVDPIAPVSPITAPAVRRLAVRLLWVGQPALDVDAIAARVGATVAEVECWCAGLDRIGFGAGLHQIRRRFRDENPRAMSAAWAATYNGALALLAEPLPPMPSLRPVEIRPHRIKHQRRGAGGRRGAAVRFTRGSLRATW